MGGILSLRRSNRGRLAWIISTVVLLIVIALVIMYMTTHDKKTIIAAGVLAGIYTMVFVGIRTWMYVKYKDDVRHGRIIADHQTAKEYITSRIPHIKYSVGKPKEMSFADVLKATIKTKFSDPLTAIEDITRERLQSIADNNPTDNRSVSVKQAKILMQARQALSQLIAPSFLNLAQNNAIQEQRSAIQQRIADYDRKIEMLVNKNYIMTEDLDEIQI